MTHGGSGTTPAATTRDGGLAAGADSRTPWDALVGAGEASFADVLRGLRPLMPATLLDGEGWTRLFERTGELPASAAAFFGFEFRLGDPDPSADLCVPVASDVAAAAAMQAPVARHFIRQARRGARLPPSRAALARCIAGFGRADSVLARWAHSVLLEYDVAALPAGSCSRPGIFFALRRKPGPSGQDVQGAARRDIAGTLANACGRTADSAEQREIERAFDALPPGARINQAGAMPDRAGRAIRLVADGIAEAAVPAFLARLRWPGRVAAATGILACLRDVVSKVGLSFDVTARGPGPRLGLELYAKAGAGWQATTRGDWQPCVARLVEKDWCTASKARGLLAWPGHQKVYADNAVFLAHQGINHLKVTVAGDVVEAKGYVGMSFVPLRPLPDGFPEPSAGEPKSPGRLAGA
jgi:hypothetical protein